MPHRMSVRGCVRRQCDPLHPQHRVLSYVDQGAGKVHQHYVFYVIVLSYLMFVLFYLLCLFYFECLLFYFECLFYLIYYVCSVFFTLFKLSSIMFDFVFESLSNVFDLLH